MSQVGQRSVVVIGCGGIGLPLAVALASSARPRVAAKAAKLGGGRQDLIDEGLEPAFQAAPATGTLAFAATLGRAEEARAYVIAVPTPASPAGGLDDGPLRQAMAEVAGAARPGDLVCLRSTLPIGATRALAAEFGGRGLGFAACPDRSIAGAAYAEQFSIPHIVGGLGQDAGARAEALFAPLGSVIRVHDPEIAEAIKLFANVERDVTFALANEHPDIAEGLEAERAPGAVVFDLTGLAGAGAGFDTRRFGAGRPTVGAR